MSVPAPLEIVVALGPLPEDEQEERTVSFKFDSNYTTSMGCTLRFSCNVTLPTLDEMTGGRRYYVEKGKIKYTEIIDMMAELLRMSVQAEMGMRAHSWRASWDRKIFAESMGTRLSFALRMITGLDFEVHDANILFVTR